MGAGPEDPRGPRGQTQLLPPAVLGLGEPGAAQPAVHWLCASGKPRRLWSSLVIMGTITGHLGMGDF